MGELADRLRECTRGRVCLMGLGNPAYSDDGFGVRLAETLLASDGLPAAWSVIVAGASPERWVGRVAGAGLDGLVFADAVDFGGAPGSVAVLDAAEMGRRFPPVSTHKVSLGLLARLAEADGRTRAWLLGVQPQSLAPGEGLTPAVEASLDALAEVLTACRRSEDASRVEGANGP